MMKTRHMPHVVSAQGLHWYSYAPPRRRWYMGQSTMLNDCLYRQRHAYDYLLFMDADEFLVVRQRLWLCMPGEWKSGSSGSAPSM